MSYNVRWSAAAAEAMGLFNLSSLKLRPKRMFGVLPGRDPELRTTCDMSSRPFYALWKHSVCQEGSIGAFDAYVLRDLPPLSQEQLQLFAYQQNAWGGENVFLYLLKKVAPQLHVRNPCLTLRVVHAHCQLPNTFSGHKVGDRRATKRLIAERAQRGLRSLGYNASEDYHEVGRTSVAATVD